MIKFRLLEFAVPGSTGSQSITGAGFQPKAVMFVAMRQSSTGYAGNIDTSIGFASGSTDDACVGTRMENAQNPTGFWGFTNPYDTRVINFDANCSLSSLDADGFTLNWNSVSSRSGDKVIAICFGGDTLSAKVGTFAGSSGTQAVTGVGFQPECLFMIHARGATWNTGANSAGTFDLGVATGSGAQWALNGISNSGASPSSDGSQFYNNKIDAWGVTGLSSFDADGFTLSIGGNYSGATLAFLALADSADGTTFKAGTETQKTSTGTKATTGIGFEPGALLLAGIGKTNVAGANQDDNYLSVGGYDGDTHFCHWRGSKFAQNPTSTATRYVTDKIISHSQPASTTDAEAQVDSLDADGFTLDWTTADATARAFGYLAILTEPTVGPVSFDGLIIS